MAGLLVGASAGDIKTFHVDVANRTGRFSHVFEACVGSGHATLALRSELLV
jgi:hypothetical protein